LRLVGYLKRKQEQVLKNPQKARVPGNLQQFDDEATCHWLTVV
jgi:hypothetical protein